ncbi:hypothetical protein, partial [Mycoplasmopsis arginini]|uniref:hypothetical protein n=1 Tax=Mycoplasmopsis arginini TaxID=2094 RepID=UPI00249F68D5
FNSFALFESACFGAKADGVYLLAGDTDAGADVRASISFGKLNFGNTLRKHVPNVYIGVASTGLMLLKVTVEGDEYIYEARRSDDEMRAQRFDLGKGLKASYYTFELFNKAGADFELDTIEFRALANSRRIWWPPTQARRYRRR